MRIQKARNRCQRRRVDKDLTRIHPTLTPIAPAIAPPSGSARIACQACCSADWGSARLPHARRPRSGNKKAAARIERPAGQRERRNAVDAIVFAEPAEITEQKKQCTPQAIVPSGRKWPDSRIVTTPSTSATSAANATSAAKPSHGRRVPLRRQVCRRIRTDAGECRLPQSLSLRRCLLSATRVRSQRAHRAPDIVQRHDPVLGNARDARQNRRRDQHGEKQPERTIAQDRLHRIMPRRLMPVRRSNCATTVPARST